MNINPDLDFIEYLLNYKNYSKSTVLAYSLSLRYLHEFLDLNNLSFDNLNTSDAENFMIHLIEKNISNASFNRHLSALNVYYDYLIRNNFVNINPFQFVSLRRVKKRIPVFLSKAELSYLLNFYKDDKSYYGILRMCILSILIFTGIRRSELLNLCIDKIDFNDMSIRIKGKGNKERYVFFTYYCKEKIIDYMKIRPALNKKKLLLLENSSAITQGLLTNIFDKINSDHLFDKHITPHVLRHSFATLLADNNVDLSYIQALLGHTSIISSDVYIHTKTCEMFNQYDSVF